jgi:hypothetical protein
MERHALGRECYLDRTFTLIEHPSIDNLLQVYSGLNKGKAHSSTVKLSNPDLAGGKFVKKILEQAGLLDLPKNFYLNLMDAAIAQDSDATGFGHLKDTWSSRLETTKYANMVEGHVDVPRTDIVTALKAVKAVYSDIEKLVPTGSFGKITKSLGLFVVLLNEFLTGGRLANTPKLAVLIAGNSIEILHRVKCASRRFKDELGSPSDYRELLDCICAKGVKTAILKAARKRTPPKGTPTKE